MRSFLITVVSASFYLLDVVSATNNACQVAHSSGGDDTPNVEQSIQNCSGGLIEFEANTTYNILSPLIVTQSNLAFSIQGNLSLPTNITAIQSAVNASDNGGYWFYFNGTNVTITGSTDATNGWINSYGQQWWDAGITLSRPHLMRFGVTNGVLDSLKFSKSIAWTINLSGANDVYIRNLYIDSRSTGSFPFNTDGIDVSGYNILIEDSVIYNGDNALAVGSPSSNITFRRAYVGYQSHGASIGSLGKDPSVPANVSDILVEDVFFENALYASRFKSWEGGTGLTRNVTYRNIGTRNVTFPIYLTQTYVDQNSPGGARTNNASVVTQNFTYDNFYGDINTYKPGDGSCQSDPCWYYEPGSDGTQAVIMRCYEGTCQNFTFANINLHPQSGVLATIICNNPPIDSPNPGFVCTNGTFITN